MEKNKLIEIQLKVRNLIKLVSFIF